jgi:hypothetical protein
MECGIPEIVVPTTEPFTLSTVGVLPKPASPKGDSFCYGCRVLRTILDLNLA